MKTIQRSTFTAVAAAMPFTVAGYFNPMSTHGKNTSRRAGVGAATGRAAGDK